MKVEIAGWELSTIANGQQRRPLSRLSVGGSRYLLRNGFVVRLPFTDRRFMAFNRPGVKVRTRELEAANRLPLQMVETLERVASSLDDLADRQRQLADAEARLNAALRLAGEWSCSRRRRRAARDLYRALDVY